MKIVVYSLPQYCKGLRVTNITIQMFASNCWSFNKGISWKKSLDESVQTALDYKSETIGYHKNLLENL